MNIFTNLLLLHGHITDPHLFDDDRSERYASELGNRAASQKFFGSLGHGRDERSDAAAANTRPAIEGCR